MKVLLDQSVPAAKRDAVHETVAGLLGLALRRHPEFPHLTAVVSVDSGGRGWDLRVLLLDSAVHWDGQAAPAVGPDLVEAVREALRLL